MSPKNGIVKDVLIDNSIKNNIYKDLSWWKKNDVINNFMIQKLGVLFLEYKSMEEMLQKTSKINEMVRVIIE